MIVFSNTPGVVGAIITGQALPFAVIIGGTNGIPSFPVVSIAKAVLTGFRVSEKSGLSISHTLRDRIYAYVFGTRAGKAQVSGVAFAGVCNTGGRWTGFDAVQAYFEACEASRTGTLVRLVLGPLTSFVGFMTDFEFNLEDANTGVGSFSFGFTIMPRGAALGFPQPLPWVPVGPAAVDVVGFHDLTSSSSQSQSQDFELTSDGSLFFTP